VQGAWRERDQTKTRTHTHTHTQTDRKHQGQGRPGELKLVRGCDCLCLCGLPLPCVPCEVIVVAVVFLGDTSPRLLLSTLRLLVLPWDREREGEEEASSRDSAVEDSPESCLSSSTLFLFLSPPLLLSASLLSFLFFCLPAFLSSSGCSHGWRRTSSRVGRSSGHFAKHNFSRFLHSGERKKERVRARDSREYERSGGNWGQFHIQTESMCVPLCKCVCLFFSSACGCVAYGWKTHP